MSVDLAHTKEQGRKQAKQSQKIQAQNMKFEKIIYGPQAGKSASKTSKSQTSFGFRGTPRAAPRCGKENSLGLSNGKLSFMQLKNLT